MIEDDKITDFREITSENPIRQIWKLLRFFLDVPSVSDMIRRIHGIPKGGKQDQNVKKQARQIGYCIRQAEEYFQASSQVDLPTRPLLLYYGASSLSWALILLRKSGEYSFDKLRKDPELRKHKHHGLDSVGEVQPDNGLKVFFNSLECECFTNEGNPRGTFALFCQSLVPCAYHIEINTRRYSKFPDPPDFFSLTSHIPCNCTDLLPIDSIIPRRLNAMELIKFLPDMYPELLGLDIQPDLCQGSVRIEAVQHYRNEQLTKTEHLHKFFIDRIYT